MKLSRYLNHLESRNLVKRLNSKQSGYEYEITSFEDYDLLKEGINILDRILEKLKAKHNGKTKEPALSADRLHSSFTTASQITISN